MSTKTSHVGSLSPEYALLGFLTQGAAHGYELHQRLEQELGQVWHLSLSQIYNILNRLENQGLIAGEIQDPGKLPARRTFHLTSTGRRRFKDWLNTPSRSSVRAIRVEFTTRLYFAHSTGQQQADEVIRAQVAATQAGLDRLIALYAEIPAGQTFNRLGLDLRIRQLASILEWLDECREALHFVK